MTTYNYADVDGNKMFYREAGDENSPSIVLLHGFPTSSHMYRHLISELAKNLHVIAPDYIGFGYSDAPSATDFTYTFDNLATHVERLLFGVLGLKTFSIYVQDYGAPVGYRIASKHPQAIDAIIVQNGNAYVEGIGGAFDSMKPFWANRNAETEKPVRTLLTLETTTFQYTHGAKNPKQISPDNWTFDQIFLDRPGNDAIQLDLLYDYKSNLALYDGWHEYFRISQPPTLILWGKNDPFDILLWRAIPCSVNRHLWMTLTCVDYHAITALVNKKCVEYGKYLQTTPITLLAMRVSRRRWPMAQTVYQAPRQTSSLGMVHGFTARARLDWSRRSA